MNVGTSPALASAGLFAVCFSCSFQSRGDASVCPRCSFPMISRSSLSPAGGIRLADVLNRDSIRLGAPPLPGVHAEKRQAQMLAEARRARMNNPLMSFDQGELGEQVVARSSRWSLLFVCLSAVGLGVAAAAMQAVI